MEKSIAELFPVCRGDGKFFSKANVFIMSATARSFLVDPATANWKLRDMPRSRSLLAEALRNAPQVLL